MILRLVPYFLGIVAAAGTLFAQDGWQTDETLAARKTEFFNAFKSGNIDSDRQGLENFFNNYYFSRWTIPANSGQVLSFARELLTQDLRDATGNAREYLLGKSFDTLRKMAADVTVTSTARYNAVLAIGQLNQREAPNRTSPPVGYAQALPYLIKEVENKENPDYIRLGALLGVVRHAQIGIADAVMRDTTVPEFLVALIQADKPQQGEDRRDREIKDWFRLRALDGLGALKNLAAGDGARDVLTSIIENPLESADMRVRAARVFGEWDLTAAIAGGAQINFPRLGTMLLSLTKSTCDQELQTITEMRDKERSELGGGSPVPGVQAEEGIGFDQLDAARKLELIAAVKRIKSRFLDILYGIRGPRLAGSTTIGVLPVLPSDDPTAAKLNAATRAMGQLFKVLDEGPEDPNAPAGPAPRPQPRPARGQQQADEPIQLKVNLVIIRDELQKFSALLDAIMAGGV